MEDINTWGVEALLRAWDFVEFFANPSHSIITTALLSFPFKSRALGIS